MLTSFVELKNRYVLTGILETQHAIHIGSGTSGEVLDATFVKTQIGISGKETIYIPGSSMRGALRVLVERILATVSQERKKKPIMSCLLMDGKECITVNDDFKEKYSKEIEKGASDQELWAYLFDEKKPKICLCCQVFGSTHLASRVRVSDLYPLDNNNTETTIENEEGRYGVAIDRETGTAKEGALFTIEALNKQNRFRFELIAENMDDVAWGILAIGLLELIRGNLYVGAKASIGLGKCQLLLDSLQMEYFDSTDKNSSSLLDYLKEGELSALSGNEIVDFLKQKIETFWKQEVQNA